MTYCGDPAGVLARHPWLEEAQVNAEVSTDPGSCVDLQIEWRDGWIELRADPFVHHGLLAPAEDRRTLGPALRDVAERLATALDEKMSPSGPALGTTRDLPMARGVGLPAQLTRVGLNRANSWLRRRLAERRAQARHGPTAEVIEEEGTGRVEADKLRRRVAILPRRQRMVVALRFYEHHSVAEAAAVMGCAEGTVKALTHQAVQQLREQLAPDLEAHHG